MGLMDCAEQRLLLLPVRHCKYRTVIFYVFTAWCPSYCLLAAAVEGGLGHAHRLHGDGAQSRGQVHGLEHLSGDGVHLEGEGGHRTQGVIVSSSCSDSRILHG